MTVSQDSEDWKAWWDARMAAMSAAFGAADDVVGHAAVPFDMGVDLGGGADVIYYRHHVPGVLTVTSELIGRDDQVPNALGNYELAICHRDDETWGPELISRLAYYTLDTALELGETMGIASTVPSGSSISALMFLELAKFEVRARPSGVLLCIGITSEELALCQSGRSDEVASALRSKGVYPYTDLFRESQVPKRKKWGFR